MQLLDYFKELTLHPKNAEELKGLILQLAIQGKLTAQWRKANPDVEPTSVLLEKVKTEKAQLVKEKKIKQEKELPSIGKEEKPFQIPANWDWCRWVELLGSVQYPMKRGPFGSALRKADFVDNGIRVFEQYNPINDDPDWVRYFVSEEKYEKLKAFTALEGDLLISCSGTLGRIGELPEGTTKGIINQALLKLTIHPKLVSNKYFIQLFRSHFMQTRIYAEAMGSAITNMVGVKELKQFPIPLPPFEEQKVIVAIVNQLFQEVAQLEALTKERVQLKTDFVTSALQQLTQAEAQDTASQWAYVQEHFGSFFTEKANVKKLRESILQLAVQGKLTSKWRQKRTSSRAEMEPASVLLERIQAEKAQLIADKKIKKEKLLPAITEEEIPYDLPEGWVWCRLGDSGYTQTGSTPPKKDPSNYGHFIPFLGPADISNNWMKYPAEGLSEQGISKGRLIPKSSLMMVCIGGSIGKCNITEKDVSCNQQINTVTPIEIPTELIKAICQSPYFQNEVFERSTGSATPIINKGKWENIPVPMPPLAEQKAIVGNVNALMTLCDNLENEIETHTTTQEIWMQSCLREVFES